MITKAECYICKKGPYLLKHLYAHLREKHGCSEDVVADLKSAARRVNNIGKEELKCDICGLIFFTLDGLNKHRRNKHTSEEVSSSSSETDHLGNPVTCPGCPEAFRFHLELAKHCKELHSNGDAVQDVMENTFDSWDDFEIWKIEKELETYTRLVRRTVRRSAHDTIYNFVCQHARGNGGTVDPQEQKTRFRKSKRIHKHCPSFAKVKHSHDGTVHVTAYFGHLGHELNTSTFRMSLEDEDIIKTMITSGIPYRTIVTKLRSEHWLDGKSAQLQPRLCFITMRDVTNIAVRNGLVDGRTSDDDRSSLRTLLEDRRIAASKLIDTTDSAGDGFVLAFVTAHGKDYLQRYGHRGLVLDDTFNVTRYSLRLATLAVVDDAGNGFSCAHLLSFRMTTLEVRHLFEVIKECVPGFAPRYVMTDDTYVFYNAFKEVFPSSSAEKILCAFHVGQTLQRKHKEVLTGADIDIGNRLFQAVLFEVEVPKFESKFSAYMTWLSSIGSTDMLTYIERNYSGRRREWASCYRRDAHFTTSNHLESWHCMLKHALLRSKQNGRLDTLTHTLLKHSEDRNLQLISSSVRDGADVSGRRRRNTLRHRNALTSYAKKADAIVKQSENCWKVSCGSQADVAYEVVIKSTCDCDAKLNSHCQRCGVCAYQVSCNCHEAYQAGVSCIHAHAVATFVEEARPLLRSVHSHSTDEDVPLYSVTEDAEMYVEESEDTHTHDSTTPPASDDVLTQDRTKEAYQYSEAKLAQVGEMLRALMKEGEHDLLRQCGDALDGVLQLIPQELRTSGTFARRLTMQTTGGGPKPKNIQPAFKTRSTLNRERTSKRKLGERNIIEETRRILTVDRTQLQTCFVCGRRNPEEDGENDVLWVSCTNRDDCRAWAHLPCTAGVESLCSVCEEGHWQYEEI